MPHAERIDLRISPQDVSHAEHIRPAHPDEAASMTQPVLQLEYEDIPGDWQDLDDGAKTLFLHAALIFVTSRTSQANAAKFAPGAAHYLGEAKRAIEHRYRDPSISAFAHQRKTDYWGNPFDFEAEMSGHVANYCVTLAYLTGNFGFLKRAVEILDESVDKATNASARWLAKFRSIRLERKMTDRRPPSFDDYTEVYMSLRDAAAESGEWERVATASARYAFDALAQSFDNPLHPRVRNFLSGVRSWFLASVKDPRSFIILPKEFYAQSMLERRITRWRKTIPPSARYEERLALSQ